MVTTAMPCSPERSGALELGSQAQEEILTTAARDDLGADRHIVLVETGRHRDRRVTAHVEDRHVRDMRDGGELGADRVEVVEQAHARGDTGHDRQDQHVGVPEHPGVEGISDRLAATHRPVHQARRRPP
jgi:hypothetical protein